MLRATDESETGVEQLIHGSVDGDTSGMVFAGWKTGGKKNGGGGNGKAVAIDLAPFDVNTTGDVSKLLLFLSLNLIRFRSLFKSIGSSDVI